MIACKKTDSGLYYKVLDEGKGDQLKAGESVNIHYTGKLSTGQVFDSSIQRKQPINFVLGQGQVISGWDEGLQLLSKGAKAQFIIPPHLAYGSSRADTENRVGAPHSSKTRPNAIVHVKARPDSVVSPGGSRC